MLGSRNEALLGRTVNAPRFFVQRPRLDRSVQIRVNNAAPRIRLAFLAGPGQRLGILRALGHARCFLCLSTYRIETERRGNLSRNPHHTFLSTTLPKTSRTFHWFSFLPTFGPACLSQAGVFFYCGAGVSPAFLTIKLLVCRRDACTTMLRKWEGVRVTRECLCDLTLTSMLAALF